MQRISKEQFISLIDQYLPIYNENHTLSDYSKSFSDKAKDILYDMYEIDETWDLIDEKNFQIIDIPQHYVDVWAEITADELKDIIDEIYECEMFMNANSTVYKPSSRSEIRDELINEGCLYNIKGGKKLLDMDYVHRNWERHCGTFQRSYIACSGCATDFEPILLN